MDKSPEKSEGEAEPSSPTKKLPQPGEDNIPSSPEEYPPQGDSGLEVPSPSRTPLLQSSSPSPCLTDEVSALFDLCNEFELDFENQFAKSQEKNLWCNVPTDDLKLIRQAKKHRLHYTESDEPMDGAPICVRDAENFFKSEWILMERTCESLGKGSSYGKTDITSLPEITMIQEKREQEQQDHLDAESLLSVDSMPPDKVQQSHLCKCTSLPNWREERHQLFSFYPVKDYHKNNTNATVVPPLLTVQRGRQILVEVQEVRFVAGDLEPFFGVLFLYDVSSQAKVSEDFYFDVSSGAVRQLLGYHQVDLDLIDSSTVSRRALFNVSAESQDLYLVLRLEKVLMGSSDDVCAPYSGNKRFDLEKAHSSYAEACEKLGEFRQVLCWGAMNLFQTLGDGDDCSMVVGEGERWIHPLIRHNPDSPFLEFLADTKGILIGKRLRALGGYCSVSVRDLASSSELVGCISPSLVPALPYDPVVLKKKGNIIREMEDFPQNKISDPHLEYKNNLYIYPEYLNLSKLSGGVLARNVSVRVQLMENDDNVNQPGLKAIYGRSRMQRFCDYRYSSITYRSKTPSFFDEIKFELPHQITKRHHVLFTFYHVNCLQELKGKKSLTHPVGYALLPLLHDTEERGHEIANGEYNLPVALSFPPTYMNLQNKLLWVDNRKPVFRVRAKMITTVFSTDKHLNTFLLAHGDGDLIASEKDLCEALPGLTSVDVSCLARHLPVVLNQLFRIMCASPELSRLAFISLVGILGRLDNSLNDKALELLQSYLKHSFVPIEGLDVHEMVCKNWVHSLMGQMAIDLRMVTRFAWFFFGIIYKSMAVLVCNAGKVDRGQLFKVQFVEYIARLLIVMRSNVRRRIREVFHTFFDECTEEDLKGDSASSDAKDDFEKELIFPVSTFCQNLLSVMDRGQVFALIRTFVHGLDGDTRAVVKHKFRFMQIITTYEHSVPLNLPQPTSDVDTAETNKHFLADLLLSLVERHLYCDYETSRTDIPVQDLRGMAAVAIRDLLIKHEFDERFQDSDCRAKVACLYMPFLDLMLKFLPACQQDRLCVRRDLLVCFLWLLKNLSLTAIHKWWEDRRREPSRIQLFFDVLMLCVTTFQFGERRDDSVQHEEVKPLETTTKSSSTKFPRIASEEGSRSLRRGRLRSASFGQKAVAKDIKQQELAEKKKTQLSVCRQKGSTHWTDVYNEKAEAYLSTEALNVVLDILHAFLERFHEDLVKERPPCSFLDKVVDLYGWLMQAPSSVLFVSHLYASLRSFVHRFPLHLFVHRTFYCGKLCELAIRHCNSHEPAIRSDAATFLYLLMKKNYEVVEVGEKKIHNFNRVKVQCTIGLSTLAGQGGSIKSIKYLLHSLSTINEYNQMENTIEVVRQPEPKQLSKSSVQSEESVAVEDSCETVEEPVPPQKEKNELPKKESEAVSDEAAIPDKVAAKASMEDSSSSQPQEQSIASQLAKAQKVRRVLAFAKREVCPICNMRVYVNEKISINDIPLHKNCFRCSHCNKVLTMQNYSAMHNRYYCKPHYKQLFARRGAMVEESGKNKSKWAPYIPGGPKPESEEEATISHSSSASSSAQAVEKAESTPKTIDASSSQVTKTEGNKVKTEKNRVSDDSLEEKPEAVVESEGVAAERPQELIEKPANKGSMGNDVPSQVEVTVKDTPSEAMSDDQSNKGSAVCEKDLENVEKVKETTPFGASVEELVQNNRKVTSKTRYIY